MGGIRCQAEVSSQLLADYACLQDSLEEKEIYKRNGCHKLPVIDPLLLHHNDDILVGKGRH